MIDWTAVATFALAVVTAALAWQVAGQTRAAREADRARQRETHLLAVRPLLLHEPVIRAASPGLPIAEMTYEVHGDLPVLDHTITLRGQAQDGSPMSYSGPPHSLPAGAGATVRLELGSFLDLQTLFSWNASAFEVVSTYKGLLGQWVVEHYEWDYNGRRREEQTVQVLREHGRTVEPSPTWRLYRLEIEPRGVAGAASIDLRFGEPPKYA